MVGPSTSAETPRSIVSTRSSRSSKRSATNSPRRAPESAAKRTSSRTCSAFCTRPASLAAAAITSASAVSSRHRTSSVLRCTRVPGACWTSHAAQRVDVDDALDMCPSDGRAQNAEASRDHGDRGAGGAPGRHGRPHVLGLERRDPSCRETIGAEGLDVGVRRDPRGRAPIVLGSQPALKQLAHGEERRGAADGAALGPLGRQFFAPEFRLLGRAVEGEERCTVRPETGSAPTATRISQTPGLRSRIVPLPHAMRAKVGTNVGLRRGSPVRVAVWFYVLRRIAARARRDSNPQPSDPYSAPWMPLLINWSSAATLPGPFES